MTDRDQGGRITTAPCGHPGEVVIGNFVACSRNCGAGSKVEQEAKSDGWLPGPSGWRPVPGGYAFGFDPEEDTYYRRNVPVRNHLPTCTQPVNYRGGGVEWCLGCGVRRA